MYESPNQITAYQLLLSTGIEYYEYSSEDDHRNGIGN